MFRVRTRCVLKRLETFRGIAAVQRASKSSDSQACPLASVREPRPPATPPSKQRFEKMALDFDFSNDGSMFDFALPQLDFLGREIEHPRRRHRHQPRLFGDDRITSGRYLPWWVAAATHLVFGWTMALLAPIAKLLPYQPPVEKQLAPRESNDAPIQPGG